MIQLQTFSKNNLILEDWVQDQLQRLQLTQIWPSVFTTFFPLLSDENPFFQKNGEVQVFYKDDCFLVGFHNPENIYQNKKYSTFSAMAGESNKEGLARLFNEFFKECKLRGSQKIVGPLTFKTCYDYRISTSKSGQSHFFGAPPYFPEMVPFLEGIGFREAHSYVTDRITNLPNLREKALARLPRVLKNFKTIRAVSISDDLFAKHKSDLLPLTNKIFLENPYFLPLEQFDFLTLYGKQVFEKTCRKTSRFLLDPSEKLVGFSFNFPDPHNSKRLLVKTLGVHPSMREGGKSFVLLLNEIIENSRSYEEISFCLMTAENQAHRLTKKHAHETLEYGLFELEI